MRYSMILFFVLGFVFCFSGFAQEQITITTYYPSPFGIYNEMRARRMAVGSNYLDASTVTVADDQLIVEGEVGIGNTDPQGALDITSTTGALIVPRMSTAERDALGVSNGMIIYNTSTNEFNFRENGAWITKN